MLDKTYPYRLWKLGKDFRKYAELMIVNKIESADSRILYFMIGHSFELVLKAFLLTQVNFNTNNNFTINELRSRRRYGHNLKKLFDESVKFKNFKSIVKDVNNLESYIDNIDVYYKDKDFEYLETGIIFVDNPQNLLKSLDLLIKKCEKICEDFLNRI